MSIPRTETRLVLVAPCRRDPRVGSVVTRERQRCRRAENSGGNPAGHSGYKRRCKTRFSFLGSLRNADVILITIVLKSRQFSRIPEERAAREPGSKRFRKKEVNEKKRENKKEHRGVGRSERRFAFQPDTRIAERALSRSRACACCAKPPLSAGVFTRGISNRFLNPRDSFDFFPPSVPFYPPICRSR